MSFNKKTIRDVNLAGKTVLVRADYNVSIKNGKVVDDFRIRESIETIKYIASKNPAKIVIIAHLGRPDGKPDTAFSLEPVAQKLCKLLNHEVIFVPDCVGDKVIQVVKNQTKKTIYLLENLRFHPEEEKNSLDFAKDMAVSTGADVFVQDAFGVAHRAHASTQAITKLLPSVAGLLLEKEVLTISQVMVEPKRPFTAVIGGAKISDKIDVLEKFIDIADCVVIGGALADDFLRAKRIQVGSSLLDKNSLSLAKELLKKAELVEKKRGFNLLLPVDAVVSEVTDGKKPIRVVDLEGHRLAGLMSYPKPPKERAYTVGDRERIADIGPMSASLFAGAIKLSKTVIWSGTMGVTETQGMAGADSPFSVGTRTIVDAMIGASNNHANKPFTVVGGGDTVGYIEAQKLTEDFNHVSTGGSASLELMAGHKLPAVEALTDK